MRTRIKGLRSLRMLSLPVVLSMLLGHVVLADPPASPEVRLDRSVSTALNQSATAVDAAGNITAVWIAPVILENTPPNVSAVSKRARLYARRYGASGVPLGAAALVDDSAYTYGSVAVASDAAGNSIVAWTHVIAPDSLEASTVRVRRLNAAGQPVGLSQAADPLRLYGANPSVAINATGDAVVVWSRFSTVPVGLGRSSYDVGNYEIEMRLFPATGLAPPARTVRRTPYDSRAYPIGQVLYPRVAINAGGAFVVSWAEGVRRNADGFLGFVQRFDRSGAAVGDPVRITDETDRSPLVSPAIDSAGNVLACWGHLFSPAIMARRLPAAGAAEPQFRVNPQEGSEATNCRVASDPSGESLVIWLATYSDQPGVTGLHGNLHAQRFDAAGVQRGPVFTLNTTTVNDITSSYTLSADGAGGFLGGWILATDTSILLDSGDIYAARCCSNNAPLR